MAKRGRKVIDITGKRFGKLVAIRRISPPIAHRGTRWLFRCDCGNLVNKESAQVRKGIGLHCGCSNPINKAARNCVILELREAGFTMQAIADDFVVSRQRVHQIIKRYGGEL